MDETCDLKYYRIKGTDEIVRAGDTVMFSSEEDTNEHIARVRSIKAHVDGNVMAEFQLYYRPEDTVAGRRPFHGSRELVLTNHYTTQSVHSILHICTVLSYSRLEQLYSKGRLCIPPCYFSRFEYDTDTALFTPDSVAVYCKCELPLNPDAFMLMCQACKEWYHPECINMTADQAEKLDSFLCSDCE